MSAEIYLIAAVFLSETILIGVVKGFEYWQAARKGYQK